MQDTSFTIPKGIMAMWVCISITIHFSKMYLFLCHQKSIIIPCPTHIVSWFLATLDEFDLRQYECPDYVHSESEFKDDNSEVDTETMTLADLRSNRKTTSTPKVPISFSLIQQQGDTVACMCMNYCYHQWNYQCQSKSQCILVPSQTAPKWFRCAIEQDAWKESRLHLNSRNWSLESLIGHWKKILSAHYQ